MLHASTATFDQLPVEVLDHLLSTVDQPESLLALACTNKVLNSLLRDPHGRHWQRVAPRTVDAPSDVTPRDVARLKCTTGCMVCGAPRVNKVHWPFLLRACNKPCFESVIISETHLVRQYRVPESIMADLPNCMRYDGHAHVRFFSRSDVDRALKAAGRPTLADYDANREQYEREAREASYRQLTTRATAMLGSNVRALGVDRTPLRMLAEQVTRPDDAAVRMALDRMLYRTVVTRYGRLAGELQGWWPGWVERLGGALAVHLMDDAVRSQRISELVQQKRVEDEALRRQEAARVESTYAELVTRCHQLANGRNISHLNHNLLRVLAKNRRAAVGDDALLALVEPGRPLNRCIVCARCKRTKSCPNACCKQCCHHKDRHTLADR